MRRTILPALVVTVAVILAVIWSLARFALSADAVLAERVGVEMVKRAVSTPELGAAVSPIEQRDIERVYNGTLDLIVGSPKGGGLGEYLQLVSIPQSAAKEPVLMKAFSKPEEIVKYIRDNFKVIAGQVNLYVDDRLRTAILNLPRHGVSASYKVQLTGSPRFEADVVLSYVMPVRDPAEAAWLICSLHTVVHGDDYACDLEAIAATAASVPVSTPFNEALRAVFGDLSPWTMPAMAALLLLAALVLWRERLSSVRALVDAHREVIEQAEAFERDLVRASPAQQRALLVALEQRMYVHREQQRREADRQRGLAERSPPVATPAPATSKKPSAEEVEALADALRRAAHSSRIAGELQAHFDQEIERAQGEHNPARALRILEHVKAELERAEDRRS
jgi:hypothetical protein